MDARELFLLEHAHVHAAAVAPSEMFNVEDLLFDGTPDEVLRACPDEHANSMIWLLWHAARSEDVGINIMLAGGAQLLDDGWARRMGVPDRDIGTGMTVDEVRRVSAAADPAAVRDYRHAVGNRTPEVIGGFDFARAAEPVPPERLAAVEAAGAILPAARWVYDFWRPQKLRFFLWLGTGHNYMHLQEAAVTKARCGHGLGL